jgi:hypothetical protein
LGRLFSALFSCQQPRFIGVLDFAGFSLSFFSEDPFSTTLGWWRRPAYFKE